MQPLDVPSKFLLHVDQGIWEFAESSLFTLFSTCLGHVFVKFEGENKDF